MASHSSSSSRSSSQDFLFSDPNTAFLWVLILSSNGLILCEWCAKRMATDQNSHTLNDFIAQVYFPLPCCQGKIHFQSALHSLPLGEVYPTQSFSSSRAFHLQCKLGCCLPPANIFYIKLKLTSENLPRLMLYTWASTAWGLPFHPLRRGREDGSLLPLWHIKYDRKRIIDFRHCTT